MPAPKQSPPLGRVFWLYWHKIASLKWKNQFCLHFSSYRKFWTPCFFIFLIPTISCFVSCTYFVSKQICHLFKLNLDSLRGSLIEISASYDPSSSLKSTGTNNYIYSLVYIVQSPSSTAKDKIHEIRVSPITVTYICYTDIT